MICNICEGTVFKKFANRENAQCVKCYSVERTRGLYNILMRDKIISPGSKVLHFAPEFGLAMKIKEVVGAENYEGYDMFPQIFNKAIGVQKFDLTKDIHDLQTEKYDLVLHSHVMEHIPCWITSVLWHLHRSLKKAGTHLFCIPVSPGHSGENIGPLSDEERKRQYGQIDHVRRFGDQDIDMTIGTVFHLNERTHDLDIDTETAERHNINAREIRRTVFKMRKEDLRLA